MANIKLKNLVCYRPFKDDIYIRFKAVNVKCWNERGCGLCCNERGCGLWYNL